MALQRLGDAHMDELLHQMEAWSRGGFFLQRAAAAALCEPRLLRTVEHARRVLDILDDITGSMAGASDRRDEGFGSWVRPWATAAAWRWGRARPRARPP
ncbi:MAG: hypothetical protein AB1445_08765 [Bacillota bacterium]